MRAVAAVALLVVVGHDAARARRGPQAAGAGRAVVQPSRVGLRPRRTPRAPRAERRGRVPAGTVTRK